MIRIERNAFLVFAALMIGAAPLRAQAGEEAQLRELMEVFARGDLLLGRIPDGSPLARVIPSDARIIGSVERELDNASTLVVIAMRGAEDQVAQRMRNALTEAGWTAMERQLPRRGGFSMVHMGVQYAVFCGEGGYMTLNTSQGRAGEVRVQVSHAQPQGGSPCEMPHAERGMDSPLPELSGPRGSRMHGGGTSASGDRHFMTSASFDTAVPVPELVAHFGAQVEEQGWEQTSTQEDSVVAVRTYTRTDDRGRRLHGTLLIVAPPGASGRETMFSVVLLAGAAR
jgi:hypothetical protein